MSTLFQTLKNNSTVTALLGTNPVRVFPWGSAAPKSARPYATYAIYNALPENYLDTVPDIDNQGTQIDIWADTVQSCDAVFIAIRDALEPIAHMLNYRGAERDEATQLFHARMEFDFWEPR
jgi:hypothetical protein